VYPCAWHLYNDLRQHVGRAGLYNSRRRIFQVLRDDMFWHAARWDHFERVFARYRNADLSKADPKLAKGIEDILKWRRRNRQAINRLLPQTHWRARPQARGRAARLHPGPPRRPAPCESTWTRGARGVEDYLASAVSHPRFAHTSSVAAALFIV
jgi:hypothetical protein